MFSPQLIGSLGVGILLSAFVLNLIHKISERSVIYLLLNVIGSLLAAWYAWAGNNIPFIILEIVWGSAALVRLLMIIKNPQQQIS